MNEQLRRIYEAAQQLPDQTQNELAARIAILLDEINEELEWDRIVSQPMYKNGSGSWDNKPSQKMQ